MNKYQKLVVSLVKIDTKLNEVEGYPEWKFSSHRRGWREALRSFKNNYAAIKGRRDHLKRWLDNATK